MDIEKEIDDLLNNSNTNKPTKSDPVVLMETDATETSEQVKEKCCSTFPQSKTPIQPLKRVYHKPIYPLPIPTNEKYQDLSIQARSKLLFDYFTKIHNLQMKQYRRSAIKAPQPKDILLKSTQISISNEENYDENNKSVYVSRAGRQIKRKDYTEDMNEVDEELKLELAMKKYKIDDSDTKITFDSLPVVSPEGKWKKAPLTRTQKLLDNAKSDEQKNKQSEKEMEDFEKSLNDDDNDDFATSEKNKSPVVTPARRGRPSKLNLLKNRQSITPSTSKQNEGKGEQKVSCPICNKKFTKFEIQEHCSSCGLEEEPQEQPKQSSSSDLLTCDLCNKSFQIVRQYEKHVKECIAAKITDF